MHAVFFASGNNMTFRGDMARRVVPVNLDPQMENPEEREGFAHSPLLAWVAKKRPRLVMAALTILCAYFDAGCPAQGGKPLGSFETWSDLIRQALIWAGEPDPCDGRKGIEAASDPEFEAFHGLLTCWAQCYGTKAMTVKQAVRDVNSLSEDVGPPNEWNELFDALSAVDPHYTGKDLHPRGIGDVMRKHQGRVIDGRRLIKTGAVGGVAKWKLDIL
jgi:hypothetical protein